jgi:lipoyl(octanoyl) transferase
MRKLFRTIDWGFKPYLEALELQKSMVEARKNEDIENTIIFTEHEPVYTLGSRKDAIKNLKVSKETLERKQVPIYKTNRGGDITFHGPGQLVIYPILKLENKDLHNYLRLLEQTIITVLKTYDLEASTRESKTGIWIENRKICAIGIAVRSWITYHGIALNLNTDLSYFDWIVPCGITDGTVTSLKNEGVKEINKNNLKERFLVEFGKFFYD